MRVLIGLAVLVWIYASRVTERFYSPVCDFCLCYVACFGERVQRRFVFYFHWNTKQSCWPNSTWFSLQTPGFGQLYTWTNLGFAFFEWFALLATRLGSDLLPGQWSLFVLVMWTHTKELRQVEKKHAGAGEFFVFWLNALETEWARAIDSVDIRFIARLRR